MVGAASFLLSSICYHLSAILYLLSSICYPLSAIHYLLSSIRYLLSAICYPLSAISSSPPRAHRGCGVPPQAVLAPSRRNADAFGSPAACVVSCSNHPAQLRADAPRCDLAGTDPNRTPTARTPTPNRRRRKKPPERHLFLALAKVPEDQEGLAQSRKGAKEDGIVDR